MNSNPITTIITNHGEATTAHWVEPSAICIAAGETVEVPFDVWSRANRVHREAILALTQSGKVSLRLRILATDNQYHEIDFAPYLALQSMDREVVVHTLKPEELPQPASRELPSGNQPKPEPVKQTEVLADGFTVRASGRGAASMARMGIQSESPLPGVNGKSEFRDIPTSDVKAPVGIQILNGRPKTEEAPKEVVKEEQAAPVVEAPAPDAAAPASAEPAKAPSEADTAKAALKAEAIAAIEGKRWDLAMQIFVKCFGSNLPFNKKAVMTLKDFDAIVQKYKLEWVI